MTTSHPSTPAADREPALVADVGRLPAYLTETPAAFRVSTPDASPPGRRHLPRRLLSVMRACVAALVATVTLVALPL